MQALVAAIGTVVLGLAALLFISFLLSWPVYMLWNGCLVGAVAGVAGVAEVTWLQAWGLSILCGFLFKPHSVTTK
jgi:hypothetical protein